MNNKVLLVAYHFPPSSEVSGALRTLSMARYLARMGMSPIILAPHPRAYPNLNMNTLNMIPDGCEVVRSLAFDVRRHFGFRGHYPIWLAQPDRWSSWRIWAVRKGLQIIRKHKPRAIWSTYPIGTAHLIASSLHRRTGIPWIADFRDPVRPPVGQERRLTARVRSWVDSHVISQANACVFVTQGARDLYENRYMNIDHGPFEVIPNGFEADGFVRNDKTSRQDARGFKPLVLVHSGVLYRKGRNPEPFFKALKSLLDSGEVRVGQLRIVLRASGSESYYEELIESYGLSGMVFLEPACNRDEALVEQSDADALLLFQGSEFNLQVPAKVYEYFMVGRPVFALVDEAGDTARLIRREGVGVNVDISDADAIARSLVDFIQGVDENRYRSLAGADLEKYSRREGARQLLQLIERVSSK